jgi:hypothetical protein
MLTPASSHLLIGSLVPLNLLLWQAKLYSHIPLTHLVATTSLNRS